MSFQSTQCNKKLQIKNSLELQIVIIQTQFAGIPWETAILVVKA